MPMNVSLLHFVYFVRVLGAGCFRFHSFAVQYSARPHRGRKQRAQTALQSVQTAACHQPLPSRCIIPPSLLSQPKPPPWEVTSRLAPSSKGYAPRNPSQPQEPIPYNGAPSTLTDVPQPVTSPRLVVCWAFIQKSEWVSWRDGRIEKITYREASIS